VNSDLDSGLSPKLCAVMLELGYADLTPIQAQSIPVLLAGRDLVGQSKTGSGKTAAFALPILQKVDLGNRSPQALVVCPTRELCAQVVREIRKLGRRHDGLQVLTVSGGEPLRAQAGALKRGVHVVVGTPGRLLDHLQRGWLETGAIATLVLDEADRMLDMGFLADIERILCELPKKRQTALFSATFPNTIETLSRTVQQRAVRVTVEEESEAREIRELAVVTEPDRRLDALYWALNEYAHESALVFCNFKATVAELETALCADGASVACLHGDMEQFERNQVLARFRNRSVRILVATDVAGRGIDVEDLDLVVNYELPAQPEIYVHRIGRTGRAGRTGTAVSLFSTREERKLTDIEALTGIPIERVQRSSRSDPGITALARGFVRDAPMQTILISGGRKDKLRPGDILGALTGDAGGLRGEDIGKIEIHDRLSYVAVTSHLSRRAAKSLGTGRIKTRRFRATLIGGVRKR
jgi:ATP-independent RNA helicase DbpA